jgi:hypothetical protein
MALGLWWWAKVRKADIPDDIRKMFEGYGETMVTLVLATRKEEDIGDLKIYWPQAVLWLRECQDKHALREDRLETVEWALLIFAIIGVIAIIPAIAK